MGSFWSLVLLFTAYSFIGWFCESIYCSVPAGHPINRGFLTGPFCPVYGFGGLLVVGALMPLRDHIFLLFVVSALLTSALEYGTGVALEKLFHAKYWDYSQNRFNFQGRVCLQNSLLFGVMSVIGVRWIQPALQELIGRIPSRVLPFLSGGILVYFLADATLASVGAAQMRGRLDELQLILDELREKAHSAGVEKLEVLQETLAERLDESAKLRLHALYERKERLESGFHLMQRRLLRAFPTMQSVRDRDSLQHIRSLLQERARLRRR